LAPEPQWVRNSLRELPRKKPAIKTDSFHGTP
jgi:hypothetical protein